MTIIWGCCGFAEICRNNAGISLDAGSCTYRQGRRGRRGGVWQIPSDWMLENCFAIQAGRHARYLTPNRHGPNLFMSQTIKSTATSDSTMCRPASFLSCSTRNLMQNARWNRNLPGRFSNILFDRGLENYRQSAFEHVSIQRTARSLSNVAATCMHAHDL